MMKPWFQDLPLDFSRTDTRAAEQLLIVGYPMNLEALNLAKNAGMDLAAIDQMAPVKFLVRDIMEKARTADRLMTLLAEVLGDNARAGIHAGLRESLAGHEARITAAALHWRPSLSTLAQLPPDVDVWGSDMPAARPLATPGLEATVNKAAGFVDPAVLRERLAEAEVRTARIDVGGRGRGTGFLVGDRLLMTNWHVVATVQNGAVARFDHKVLADTDLEADPGRPVPFADDWLVAHSGHGTREEELGPAGPAVGNWDYAIVRLAEPAGAQPIGPDPQADGDTRGRYQLDGGAYEFHTDETIHILGHPLRRPQQLSYASPSNVTLTEHRNRVRYDTNTESGSSGSPVFNRDWRVVALHHGAGPTAGPGPLDQKSGSFNQGIPISDVVLSLRAQLAGRPELAELGLD